MRVFIGFEPRERDAYLVAAHSLRRHASIALEIEPLVLEQVRWKRLYNRPHEVRDGRLWDVLSGAPMATEFALTRFLVPHLMGYRGVALFIDCDFLFRRDVAELFKLADPACAVQVVKHAQKSAVLGARKMDGQIQTDYARKNWSSCVLWNCGHDAHAGQLDRVNRWRGLWLHQFRWLQDADIGALPEEWNWLEGLSELPLGSEWSYPAAVHYTRGTPDLPGYLQATFAPEWREALAAARGGREQKLQRLASLMAEAK